jgi:RNA polymerase sigma factor for flagellar operon FliA
MTNTRLQTGSNVEETWNRYLCDRLIEDRNALVVYYSHLVENHAGRLARRLPHQITLDEIRSAAFDGLMQAVENYDPRRSAKFETYCQQRIAGAVMDWLRSVDPQSRTVRTFEKHRNRVREALDTEIGRSPTHHEVAGRMRMPTRRYEELNRLSQAGNEVHFSAIDSSTSATGAGSTRCWDVADEKTLDPAHGVTRQMLTDHFCRGLTRDERMILILYYYEGLTMAEIGAVLELSESRVSQIHKDVLARLRQRFGVGLIEELAV